MIAFGPVPSRRLGSSLGVNHIPPKNCSYSCVYCQVGRTTNLQINQRSFYSVDQIFSDVENKVSESIKAGQKIDYITLVPDGEPTLDVNLEKVITSLKALGFPIAVISNAGLIDLEDIQTALSQADWVSLKVDAVIETDWRKVNRPHHRLSLPRILAGIKEFGSKYQGKLATETMLVAGINDSERSISNLSEYLLELQPYEAYLSIPTRPPAEPWVRSPDVDSLRDIFHIMSVKFPYMKLLFETESADFSSTGNLKEDILSITAVHPIREEALRRMVARAAADWSLIEELVESKLIACVQYREDRFYIRKFPRSKQRSQ